MRRFGWFAAACCVVFGLAVAPVSATVVVSHVGATDPATESWGYIVRASGEKGAVDPDPYDGTTPAWYTKDPPGSNYSYYKADATTWSDPIKTQIVTHGWRSTVTVRADRPYQDGDLAEIMTDLAGSRFWVAFEALPGTGMTRVKDLGTATPAWSYDIPGLGYHTCVLDVKPTNLAEADLWVDGTFLATVPRTKGVSTYQVTFGNSDWGLTGSGYWNLVKIEAGPLPPVPEPSVLVLLGTGFLGLLAYAWRRRR